MPAVKDPEGFAGPERRVAPAPRHLHQAVADRHRRTARRGPRRTKRECDAVGGTLLKQTQYLLHVWVVPGYESPEGVYAHLSSAVTCDDGTYRTIKDVTKVGDADVDLRRRHRVSTALV